jgi:endonuclease/exonuclease/phosphatase (EEP) superfamily protein YafD
MKKIVVAGLALISCWFVGSTGSLAQTTPSGQGTSGASANQASIDQDVSLLRKNLRAQKKQLIAANLALTADEATKFWPVYDQYAAELSKLGDQKYALIKEYAQGFGSLTNEQALSLINRSLALDEKIAQLRSKYVPIVNQVLPGTKTATFFQLDRRITSLIDMQLATEIPLVQQQN